MKPVLYEANAVDFNNNGLGTLTEAMFSQVTEERNGIFELSVVYPMSGKLYDKISEHMLLKVKPNKVDDPHVFRIYSLQIDSMAQTVSIDASTKSNELVNNLVKDLAIENTTPQVALDLMKQFLVLPTDYDFISDITSSNSTHWTNRNPLNCIAGEEGSLVDVFGGEIKRGNRTIWLYANRGIDNPNIIRHGKNLQGFTVEYSTKGMRTAILPYFNEKIEDSSETQMVYGDIVYSQYANNYPFLYLVAMDYSSEEEVTDLTTLNNKASTYFTENNGIDKPSMTANVDMQDLSDSSEYKKFKNLEQIQLCDTVTIYSKKHKVNLKAKVTKLIFDTLLEKNVSLELGSIRTSLTDSIKQGYTETIQDLQQNIYQTIETAANGKNRVFRGIEEPVIGMIENDVWYKPVNDGEIEMYVFDGATWNKEAYSADSLGGTVNFANINAINLNLNTLTTASITGANMWLNLITGEMQFTNPMTGDILVLNQGEILFQNDTNTRHLKYTSEGLKIVPGASNTGTNLNTSIRLHGGITYLDFFNDITGNVPESTHRARMESNGEYIYLRTANGEKVHIIDWGGDYREIVAGAFTTAGSGNPTYHYADRWETPRDGDRSLVASPNGTGKFYVSNPEQNAFYSVWASSFDVSSSLDFKKAIEYFTGNATDLINGTPVRLYHLNEDVEGVDVKRLGLIVEESPLEIVNTDGGKTIDLYEMASLLWKGNQELSEELSTIKQELADLKTLLTEKGVI